MSLKTYTDANFQTEVLDSKLLTLVLFTSTQGGDYSDVLPILKDLADDYSGEVNIGTLDLDNNSTVAGQCGINKKDTPILLFYKDGSVVDEASGTLLRNKGGLIDKIIKSK